jgi:hypothetical protein
MSNLQHLKIGDKIFTTERYSGNIKIYTIEKQTEKFHIIILRDKEYKIEKETGYQYGSRGSGRFASFDSVYFNEVTPNIIKERNIQAVQTSINNLSGRIQVNEENYEEIYNALNIILKYKKERK